MKIDHACIHVTNLEREIEFYQDILGLKVIWRAVGPSVTSWKGEVEIVYLGFDKEGPYIELVHESSQGNYKPGGKFDHICFTIDNMDQKIKEWKAKGVNLLLPPKEPVYTDQIRRIAFIEDPEGIKIEIIQRG